MPTVAYAVETEWLHQMLAHGGADIFFPVEVDERLRKLGSTRPELLSFLSSGQVTSSEKGAFGWRQCVDGSDCDGRRMHVVLEIESSNYRIEVIEVLFLL